MTYPSGASADQRVDRPKSVSNVFRRKPWLQGCHCRMTCTFFSYCLPNTSSKWPLPSELVSSFCEFAISDRQSIRPAIWGGKENFDAKELWITTLERVKYKGEKGLIWDVFVKTFHIIDPINTIICPQQAIERKSVTSRYHGSKISGSQQKLNQRRRQQQRER